MQHSLRTGRHSKHAATVRINQNVWLAVPLWSYLAAGSIGLLGYLFLASGGWTTVAQFAIGASAAAAICVGVKLHKPTRPTPWYLIAAGQLSWVLGDALSRWYHDVASPAGAFHLAGYPMMAIALLMMIRGRRYGRDAARLLESAMLTAGAGLIVWVLLARPAVSGVAESLAATGVGPAYPIFAILIAGVLIRHIAMSDGRTPALWFLMGAAMFLVLGNTASYTLGLLNHDATTTLEVLSLGAYLAWGAAALHPSMTAMSEPADSPTIVLDQGRLALLAVATLVAPGTLAVELALHLRVDGWAIVVGTVVSLLLVVARMRVAIEQIIAANRHREQEREDLAHRAAHDSLTSLPNRAQALHLIHAALSRAQRTGVIVGLLFIDLDGFKAVNDNLGHPAGDEVLATVAGRMQQHVRGGDVVARLGGDEFVVLLEPVDSQASVIEVAERLVTETSKPITLSDGIEASVGASIGVAISMDGATDADKLMADADAAVYRAKRAGRGRVEVFDDSLREELSEQARLAGEISSGLQAGEFVVQYQPIVQVATRKVQGYEALIRWERPGVGMVAPDAFIPIAEESILICELDCWVLRQALNQLVAWSGEDRLTMAVNISGRHLARNRIVSDVRSALRDTGVAADQLILEINESILIEEPAAIGHLHQLRDMGVCISIDNFGTGYNSVARLQHLPVDIIKIDRSFLADTQPAAAQLFEVMVQAAHACGIPVVAGGVEHDDQLSVVRSVACESAQGFLFARPMPAAAVRDFPVNPVNPTDAIPLA